MNWDNFWGIFICFIGVSNSNSNLWLLYEFIFDFAFESRISNRKKKIELKLKKVNFVVLNIEMDSNLEINYIFGLGSYDSQRFDLGLEF